MKTKTAKLCSLLLIAGIKIYGQTTFTADHQNIQYTGRISFDNPLHPVYKFPGVSIRAKFNGTEVKATIYDYGTGGVQTTNYYKVFIDNVIQTEQLEMVPGEQTYTLATGLVAGDHTVEIMKITEGASGKSSFKGFTISGGSETLLTPDDLPNKRIEFIGDSWTCGFGNLSQFATGGASMVNGNYVAENEDNYYAWGPITARALGAQYHVTAISGRGLYRNNTGSMIGTLPKNYDYVAEDESSMIYDHSSFNPDVVSIHLGTNDMALEEGGASNKLDDEAFKNTYIEFVDKILTLHPCATVIMCFGNSKSDSWPTWTKQLTRLRNIAKDISALYPAGNVTYLELPYTAEKWTGNTADDCGYGDAWHPSKCSHEEMSSKLVEKINALNIEWGANNCSTSKDEVISDKMSVFPNPTSNYLTLKAVLINPKWEVVNQFGQQVQAGIGKRIEVGQLSYGLYLLKVYDGSSFQNFSFLKQ